MKEFDLSECLFHDKYLNGVEDYSDEFRKAFNITGHTYCKELIMEYKKENLHLDKDWESDFQKHYNHKT